MPLRPLGLLTINGLTAADSVLVPIQCEYYALEGLSQLVSTIAMVQEHLNPTPGVGRCGDDHVRCAHQFVAAGH